MNELDWDLIRVFLKIQQAGSFSGAAQTLGIDESTVRRRLGQLERQLGIRLFSRTDGRLQFCEEHQLLANLARQMDASGAHFLDCAKKERHGGAVRVSLIDLFAIHFATDIAVFQQANPEILLDITTEPHTVDLGREGVDIAIRMARPLRGENKLQRVGTIGFGLYGSEAYLAANGPNLNREHTVVALGVHFEHGDHEFELFEDQWLRDLSWLGKVAVQTDCYPVMLRICEAGSGLALLPHFLASQSDKLAPYQPARINITVDVWCVVRQEMADLPKVRKVIELFRRLFQERLGGARAHVTAPIGETAT